MPLALFIHRYTHVYLFVQNWKDIYLATYTTCVLLSVLPIDMEMLRNKYIYLPTQVRKQKYITGLISIRM